MKKMEEMNFNLKEIQNRAKVARLERRAIEDKNNELILEMIMKDIKDTAFSGGFYNSYLFRDIKVMQKELGDDRDSIEVGRTIVIEVNSNSEFYAFENYHGIIIGWRENDKSQPGYVVRERSTVARKTSVFNDFDFYEANEMANKIIRKEESERKMTIVKTDMVVFEDIMKKIPLYADQGLEEMIYVGENIVEIAHLLPPEEFRVASGILISVAEKINAQTEMYSKIVPEYGMGMDCLLVSWSNEYLEIKRAIEEEKQLQIEQKSKEMAWKEARLFKKIKLWIKGQA